MATNKPVGDKARKGAVRKRTQLRSKAIGELTWTKRNKSTGKFMDQKKAPAKTKFKGCDAREGIETSRRHHVFLVDAARDDHQSIIGQGTLQRLGLVPWRAQPNVALLAGGEDITGMALG